MRIVEQTPTLFLNEDFVPDWQATLRDPANQVYLSVVSVWEASIKYRLGKLPLPAPPETYLPLQRQRHLIASVPLEEAAISQIVNLPALHCDPSTAY